MKTYPKYNSTKQFFIDCLGSFLKTCFMILDVVANIAVLVMTVGLMLSFFRWLYK